MICKAHFNSSLALLFSCSHSTYHILWVLCSHSWIIFTCCKLQSFHFHSLLTTSLESHRPFAGWIFSHGVFRCRHQAGQKGRFLFDNHITLCRSHTFYIAMLYPHWMAYCSSTSSVDSVLLPDSQGHTQIGTRSGGALPEQLGPSCPGTVPTQTQLLDCFCLGPMKYQECLLFFFPKMCFCICFRHMHSKNNCKSYKPDH